jgi:hypothetical protein
MKVGEEEDKRVAEVLSEVKPKAAFYRRLGKAALMKAPVDFGKRWEGPECALDLTANGNLLELSGEYEQDANILGVLSAVISRKETRRVVYTLRLQGEMLAGEVKRTTVGQQPTLASLGMDSIRVVMYFDAELKLLRAMEGSGKGAGRSYELKRVG